MKLENIIVMMGPPGSGKGTQTKLLAKELGYEHFSTGDLSREYAKQDTDLGREIKSTIEQGIILPINIIKQIFVKKFETLIDSPGVILDGYPRTPEQADLLKELMKKYGIKNIKAFFLNVDKQKLIHRLQKRKTCPNCQAIYLPGVPEYDSGVCSKCGGSLVVRADDDPAIVEKRFDEYISKTAPVKEQYEKEGVLIHIQGDQSDIAEESIKKVHQEIMEKLKS